MRTRKTRHLRDDVALMSAGFTPRQVTAVVVALLIAVVLVPRGAMALGSLVTIEDANSTRRAAVDTGGKLRVGGGSGRFTVNGTVGSFPGLPSGLDADTNTPFQFDITDATVPGASSPFILAGPFTSSQSARLTMLGFTNTTTSALNVILITTLITGADCSTVDGTTNEEVVKVRTPANDTRQLTFPQPLVIDRPGAGSAKWCLRLITAQTTAWVQGYVP